MVKKNLNSLMLVLFFEFSNKCLIQLIVFCNFILFQKLVIISEKHKKITIPIIL